MAMYFQEKKFTIRVSKDIYEFLKNLGQERKKFITLRTRKPAVLTVWMTVRKYFNYV